MSYLNELNSENFEDLLCSDHFMLDVRSEIEFQSANIPGSINLPILKTPERSIVGYCYKKYGANAALSLAHSITAGDSKKQRTQEWISTMGSHHSKAILCARGGMRSGFAQEWLVTEKKEIPRIVGGYKALRAYLQRRAPELCARAPLIIVSGKTGSGKTALLKAISSFKTILDLEDLAKHSGSAFGDLHGIQPGQATFENALFVFLLRHFNERGPFYVEDESRMIGKIVIPKEFFLRMSTAPILLLEASLEERADRIIQDYIIKLFKHKSSLDKLQVYLFSSLAKISRKLGGALTSEVSKMITDALIEQDKNNEFKMHAEWIKVLLKNYYDPSYERGINQNSHRIIAKGNRAELMSFIKSQEA